MQALYLVLLSIPFLVLMACGGTAATPPAADLNADGLGFTPTPESSPTPRPTNTPAPTATPLPVNSQVQAENLVLRRVTDCAGRLASLMGTEVAPDFATTYSSENGEWLVEVFSKDPDLSFGTWLVGDAGGDVAPQDNVAQDISNPGFNCLPPLARRARGRTPPFFATPVPRPTPNLATATPPPLPTQAPLPKVSKAEDAATAVWVSVYACYGHFPVKGSFTATDHGSDRWIVEGRSSDTMYGLWSVDASSGEISPVDQLARQARDNCQGTPEVPIALNAEQAALRVWMAAYQCFTPRPRSTSFVGHLVNPQRWVVEGRQVQEQQDEDSGGPKLPDVLYGFWLVDTDTAEIQPWDALATSKAGLTCFKHP